MSKGTVKFFNATKGFGFITEDENNKEQSDKIGTKASGQGTSDGRQANSRGTGWTPGGGRPNMDGKSTCVGVLF